MLVRHYLRAVNTHRLAYGEDNHTRIKVDQPVAAARIVVRNHPAPSELTRNGRPVAADRPCDTRRPGMNELYRQTEPFRLEVGEHVLTIEDGAIKALPETVSTGALWEHGLADFAGQVTYMAQVDIPSHAGDVKLRINTGGLYTSVSLDGHALGERAWAPFEWTVPAELRGKQAELKINVWTSVAPLFGDWKNPNAVWKKDFWIPPPEPRTDIGPLSAPEWVLVGD